MVNGCWIQKAEWHNLHHPIYSQQQCQLKAGCNCLAHVTTCSCFTSSLKMSGDLLESNICKRGGTVEQLIEEGPGLFLLGVSMFSLWMGRFTLGTPIFSHISKTWLSIGYTLKSPAVWVCARGCAGVCVGVCMVGWPLRTISFIWHLPEQLKPFLFPFNSAEHAHSMILPHRPVYYCLYLT